VTDCRYTTVETWSGRVVDLARPSADDIDLTDIAIHLARIPRFNGATRYCYSVAQHSILVSILCQSNRAAARWAILHDAHEAYLGDLTTPMKRLLFGRDGQHLWASIVDRFDDAIGERFGVHRSPVIEEQIKIVDRLALSIESFRLMPSCGTGWPDTCRLLPQPIPALPCAGLDEETVVQAFLDRCRWLGIDSS
jgi:uncharacterized protein